MTPWAVQLPWDRIGSSLPELLRQWSAIPASHSVGIEVLEKLGGRPVLDYLVCSGDSLPKKGRKVFKAAESLKAGAAGSLNLKLWEGEIEDPITDNRPIGVLKISGSDFDDGVIHAGADLECEYEILDSGNVIIEVSVPCIGGTFHSGKNFYSRQEGQLDYTEAVVLVVEEGERDAEQDRRNQRGGGQRKTGSGASEA